MAKKRSLEEEASRAKRKKIIVIVSIVLFLITIIPLFLLFIYKNRKFYTISNIVTPLALIAYLITLVYGAFSLGPDIDSIGNKKNNIIKKILHITIISIIFIIGSTTLFLLTCTSLCEAQIWGLLSGCPG